MQPSTVSVQGTGWQILMPPDHTACMTRHVRTVLLVVAILFSVAAVSQYEPGPTPQYNGDKQLKFPENYREWIYLSTGFDMSYNPAMRMGHHMFDSVFVNPEAYKSFLETGTWPDKTMLVLEARAAVSKGSINQSGNYQSTERMAVEVHVRDEKQFPGKWAFFGFDDNAKTSTMIPTSADCYSCHATHGAVDTTFVQFYPTLLPIAKSKGTLSASYVKETAGQR